MNEGQLSEALLKYVARSVGTQPDDVAKVIGCAMPDYLYAQHLDDELIELWPYLSFHARAIAMLLASQIARETQVNEDQY